MVSELVNLQAKTKMSSNGQSLSNQKTDLELNIQSFHQCSSLISIKLNTHNFLLWRNQITPIVCSLGLLHHLTNGERPAEEGETAIDQEKCPNPNYQRWIGNDGLLTSWLLGTMKEDVLSIINGETSNEIWTPIEEQLMPAIIEKERNLKIMLMTIKKESRSLEEYLKDFKSIYDNLVAIKSPVSNQDKVFQFAHGLGPSCGRNGRNGKAYFNSQGKGFTPGGRYNSQNGQQSTQNIRNYSKQSKIIKEQQHFSEQNNEGKEDFPQALVALTLDNSNNQSFIVDSGATSHMIKDLGNLSFIKPYDGNDVIYVGNGNSVPITHTGDVLITTDNGKLKLKDVLVLPDLKKNYYQ
ncbi:hypothetical protein GH714_008816 [Hevea brasiliensis]|uniref:Retrovirus-related Pol polyprotein from transposon TNT 1-94-like beta-barrel domain-containing protein n=1 Tax=Hevea brasiliensis TaxID=3981 RepID=A0A6A6KZ19_HEVBR|nr:hypothetical protein GH714_008772 [Hevea brasiliensis]KAF2294281.1 hypothetical protein GH714_008816 [Hevea brasiliensis]